ncbi:ral guanine nucleotide dissociation stimulator [Tetranychus urticae]|uniref:Ras-GEF domain-containing protein n=1 Tax=Tetranychus urticae TaxID=32264 RepID=T1L5B1_TETUR|nr:ral guanine nucleotide dissociation stimulator [Tetranychus urticae]XP_015793877.1 ral guanine nucleotide dissociation stimulator [Tetranychus urticae]XP_025018273.1 ral guanine nucleotide dissociation stimulator [Tetranychus urticae]XP_025018274.1 ral guanine nucleotide dissociation stimulator [Tetranychus urticae]
MRYIGIKFWRSDRKLKKDENLNVKRMARIDQPEERRRQCRSKSVDKDDIKNHSREKRRVRILKAATMDHIIEYILLLTPHQRELNLSATIHHCSSLMEEGRNDVTHIMHVIFCTYRKYCSPQDLFAILVKHSKKASPQQLRFVLHYWLRYYPEDFLVPLENEIVDSTNDSNDPPSTTTLSNITSSLKSNCLLITNNMKNNNENCIKNDETSKLDSQPVIQSKSLRSSSISPSPTKIVSSSTMPSNQRILLDLLLELPCVDDTLYRKAYLFIEQSKFDQPEQTPRSRHNSINKSPSYCIIDLDTKFVAQQLTAIDLENFLSLKPYTLLNGHRHNPRVQNMIRNFNLLSKHVVVTILKAHSPDLVTTHWINIAQQLRKMKNFNSLKAVIAGLSNESVFRLKQTVWSKISKTTEATFKHLSTIVDDVDNQTLLRQTQLEIEGTAKVCFEEESFGSIPYLGTFLTDLTFIDTKLTNYIENPKEGGKRLINLEKCCKQFEIITQIRLLQQNIKASLFALYQSHQLNGFTKLPPFYSNSNVPRIVVARLFRTWFNDLIISNMTDNDCYKLSLALEAPSNGRK